MKNLASGPLAGPQFYPYCFNIDIINGGSATPEGVTFPGAYKPTDYGIAFSPWMTYDEKADQKEGNLQNSKYVRHQQALCSPWLTFKIQIPPGPPVYKGKYDAPTGPVPVVKETGAYTGELQTKYDALTDKLEAGGSKLADFVNGAWPLYKPDQPAFKQYTGMVVKESAAHKKLLNELMTDIQAFKRAYEKTVTKRWTA
jgi:hypothetical protein